MRLRFFGGFAVETGDAPAPVRGRGQESLLYRLALDAGTTVAYRALAEDVWPDDPPDDPRAALQSLASRLRRALPPGTLEAVTGGYRLAVSRDDVDVARFQDLVAAARAASDGTAAAALARDALALWTGDPWTPSDGFDWVVQDLLEDRAHAERLARGSSPVRPSSDSTVADAAPSVPAALTTLVGRARELDLIALQLGDTRIVTVVGPGGAGKTTLALETARRRQGAIVVELAPAADGEVWPAVAGAVGRSIRVSDAATPAATAVSARDRAVEALAGREVLLVMDNCEHVSAEAAAVALDLLRAVAGLRILATSREPLGLPGEAFVDLGPLPERDAVELFSRRVRAARGEAPAADDERHVERIVRRLDGLPLALELAAAKTRTLTLAEVDAGLDDRFALLESGPRAVEARHRTLRALIDWSWETLTEPEQTALLTIAVFPDGLGADDAVVAGRWAGVGAAAFDALVDRSLLHRSDGRFRMLETVREYGVDRLRSEGREAEFRAAQARAMAELALEHDTQLRGRRVREGLAWFDSEEENLSAAIRTCSEQPGLHDTGVRLVRGALWAWLMRERFEELRSNIVRFASLDDALETEASVVVCGAALLVAAFAATMNTRDSADPAVVLGGFDARREAIAEAAARHPSDLAAAIPPLLSAIWHALSTHSRPLPMTVAFRLEDADPSAPPWTHGFVGVLRAAIAQNNGDTEALGVESERSLRVFRELGDVWGMAFASQMRSEWLMLHGRLEEALEVADAATRNLEGLTSVADRLQQRSQTISLLARLGRVDEARAELASIEAAARDDGSQRALAQAEFNGAVLEIALGDGAAALAHLDRIDPVAGPGFPEQLVAWAHSKRAQACILLGDLAAAREALRGAVAPAVASGDQPIVADVALSIAGWLAASDRPEPAALALRSTARLRGGLDATDPFLKRVRARIGPAAEATGPTSDLEQLAALLDD